MDEYDSFAFASQQYGFYLNHAIIFDWLTCNGIVKGNIVEFSEKPLASIPFRAINWHNSQEVSLHNRISEMTEQYLKTKEQTDLHIVNQLFDKLLKITHKSAEICGKSAQICEKQIKKP